MDLIEIDRIARALERPRFRERVYTEAEREYCDSKANPAQSYAARFAGKEAVGKALGCGVDFAWREIEIVGRPKPSVKLSGRTLAFAEKHGLTVADLSVTHSRGVAGAVALVVWPGMAHLSAETVETYADGGAFARVVTVGEHTGTHLDAPAHFHEGGLTVEGIPAGDLVCEAAVIDVRAACLADADYTLSAAAVHAHENAH